MGQIQIKIQIWDEYCCKYKYKTFDKLSPARIVARSPKCSFCFWNRGQIQQIRIHVWNEYKYKYGPKIQIQIWAKYKKGKCNYGPKNTNKTWFKYKMYKRKYGPNTNSNMGQIQILWRVKPSRNWSLCTTPVLSRMHAQVFFLDAVKLKYCTNTNSLVKAGGTYLKISAVGHIYQHQHIVSWLRALVMVLPYKEEPDYRPFVGK